MTRYNKIFLTCLLGLLLSTSITSAQQEPEYKEGELLIKFRSRISSQAASISHATLGSQLIERFGKSGIQRVRLRADLTTKEAIELYKKDPSVEYAEPNYKLYAQDLFPNDLRFNDLWGLHNTGEPVGNPDADIDAPEAWQMTTGSDEVIVAVIDSGVDYEHEDLSENMWVNIAERDGEPGTDDDANGYIDDIYGIDTANDDTDPMDDCGHGTHCAGTIGAIGDNGIGVVGINWNVKVMALKYLDADGSGLVSDAIDCLEYAIMMKQDYGHNIRISSNSWVGSSYSHSLYDTIQAAGDVDILFVASAGNYYQDSDLYPVYPASYDLPNIIAVTATDYNDDPWYVDYPHIRGSNWGLTTVDVAAPGASILSCTPGNNYGYMSGTSMAASHVSGLAALILARYPEFSSDQVRWVILLSVDPLGSLEGRIFTGGRINANSALAWTPSSLGLVISSPSLEFVRFQNSQTVIRALVGTYDGPASDATVKVDFDNREPSLTLHDDGVYPDLVADDGLHSGFWIPQELGDVTLTIRASAPGYDPDTKQVSGTVDLPGLILNRITLEDLDNQKIRRDFTPGTNVRYGVKFTVYGDPAKLYQVVVSGKAFSPPVGQPKQWEDKFDNPKRGKKRLYGGKSKRVYWDRQVPTEATPGTQAKVRFTLKLREYDEATETWNLLGTYYGKKKFNIVQPDESDIPTDASGTEADESDSEPDEPDEQVTPAESSDEPTDGSTGEQTPTASAETDESNTNTLFGVGGGFSPYSSGDVGAAGEESEEAEEAEEKEANKQTKSGDLSTMTKKRPALGRQPRRIESGKGTTRGRKTARTGRSEGRQRRGISQRARKTSRSPSRPSSFLNDKGIPNVIVKGILHCGAGDPRNIAIVELFDGRKCRIQEGDIFSSIAVVAIFERRVQLRYKEQVFESNI